MRSEDPLTRSDAPTLPLWLFCLPPVLFALLAVVTGDEVPVHKGLGWDGVVFARLVRELPDLIAHGQLGTYYCQRILPCTAVRAWLSVSGWGFSDAAVIRGFQCYNLAVVLGCAWAWCQIGRTLRFSRRQCLVGLAALLVNFEAGKYLWFVPVMTDASALLVGCLSLLFYLRGQVGRLCLVTLLGALCWPTVALTGCSMLLLPRRQEVPPDAEGEVESCVSTPRWLWGVWWALVAIAWGANFLLRWRPQAFAGWLPIQDDLHLRQTRAFFTALPSIAGMGGLFRVLLGRPDRLLSSVDPAVLRKPATWLAAGACLVGPALVVAALASPTATNPNGIGTMVGWIIFEPEGKVLLPAVGLASFWGPLVLYALMHWNRTSGRIRLFGPGLLPALLITLPTILTAEPRYATCVWPILAAACVTNLQESLQDTVRFRLLLGVMLVCSCVWLPMDVANWPLGPAEDFFAFPKQRLFLHFGIWSSRTMYLLQLALGSLLCVWFARRFHREK